MDMIIKVPMFILLGLIIFSLGQAMFYLGRDDGEVDRTRMVRALTVDGASVRRSMRGYSSTGRMRIARNSSG